MDINTKQRPVPNELLLDIKRLADTETDQEALSRDIFDLFQKEQDSPLFGLLTPSEKQGGKISRVTFNAAFKPVLDTFAGSDAKQMYAVLCAYLHACLAGLRTRDAADSITNPTFFRAILLLFPTVAERVSDRHGQQFTAEHFDEILAPFFTRVKKAELQKPSARLKDLQETLRKALQSGFSINVATS